MKTRYLWMGLVLLLALVLVTWLLLPSPTVVADPVSGDPVTLKITKFRINGIHSVIFWSATEEKYLWVMFPEPRNPPTEVVYGKTAEDGSQSIPRDETPPRPIKVGEKFYVCIVFTYDKFFAASGGDVTYGFELQEDRTLRPLGRIRDFNPPPPH